MKNVIPASNLTVRPKAPKKEELELKFSDKAMKELSALLKHYPNKKAAILPTLWLAQREYGGTLSADAMAEVAFHLDRSYAEIEGVATFYSLYNTKHAVGKHLIEVCTCLTCQVCDGFNILKYLCAKLDIKPGETTSDGLFTVHPVECLNACDRAPVLQVGDEYLGPVDTLFIDELIRKLKETPDSTVVKYADEVVQVHLRDVEKA